MASASHPYHNIDHILGGGHYGESLLHDEHTDSWDIRDLDAFFLRVYRYWSENGFHVILASRVVSLCTLGFTILFSTFLMLFVNWHGLFACARVGDTCTEHQVFNGMSVLYDPTFMQGVVWTYFAIFSLYWLWHFLSVFYTVRSTLDMRAFFHEKLRIRDTELPTMEWHVVINRVVKLQESVRLCIVKDLTQLDITNRILRKDNYLVALVNMGVMDCDLPCWSGQSFFGKALEWNLRFSILNYLFDNQFQLHPEFVAANGGVARLQRRFVFMGVVNLLLMPFIMLFMVIFFFLRHAEEFHSRKDVFGRREWTTLAKWKLREYNELPHFFNRRLQRALEPADAYIAQFPMVLIGVFAQFVGYMAGAFVSILLVFGFVDSKVLTQVFVADRTLLWWLAIFTTILAISRALIYKQTDEVFDPTEKMAAVVQHTHYLPTAWVDRTHTDEVKREFELLCSSKLLVLVEEMVSVLTTPFVLFFSLPRSAEHIVDFISRTTVNVNGVGAVCTYALFDFQNHGDGQYLAPVDSNQPSRHGKMEKSFLTFAINHPHWNPDLNGSQFLTNMASILEQQQQLQLSQLQQQQPPHHHHNDPHDDDMPRGDDGDGAKPLMGSFSELLELRTSLLLPEMSRLARNGNASVSVSALASASATASTMDIFVQLENVAAQQRSVLPPVIMEEQQPYSAAAAPVGGGVGDGTGYQQHEDIGASGVDEYRYDDNNASVAGAGADDAPRAIIDVEMGSIDSDESPISSPREPSPPQQQQQQQEEFDFF